MVRVIAQRVPFKVAIGSTPSVPRERIFNLRDWKVVQFEVEVTSR
jgi:hypothetical protein